MKPFLFQAVPVVLVLSLCATPVLSASYGDEPFPNGATMAESPAEQVPEQVPEQVQEAPQRDTKKFGGNVAVGVAMMPEYEGAEDYRVLPLLAGRLSYDTYYVQSTGLGLRMNVSPLPFVEFGPSIGGRFGRDDDTGPAQVRALRDIDATVEGGGFIRVPFRQVLSDSDEFALQVEALTDMGGVHDGTMVTFGPSYNFAPTQRLRLGIDVSSTYVTDNYAETYYSIDADNALRSGFAQYSAEAGIKDVGVRLNAMYYLNESWGVMGLAGYTQLIGDAADSPIIQSGDEGQFMFGTGLIYNF